MKVTSENLVVIHLTSSAVYTVVGCESGCGKKILIKAVGIAKCEHFSEGRISHREKVIASIKDSIRQAEEMAMVRIYGAWVSFSTPELVSSNNVGELFIGGDKVEYGDMVSALNKAKLEALPEGHYLMHHTQLYAWLDDGDAVKEVIGLTASKLKVYYHLMSMPATRLNDIYNLFQTCSIHVDYTMFDAVSSAEYALIEEERAQGVLLVDIGAYSTSVCLYKENLLIFSTCIGMGGYSVTMDISAEFGISLSEAERLKRHFVSLDVVNDNKKEFVEYIGLDGNKEVVSKFRLRAVAKARYDMIFDEIKQRLKEQNLDMGFADFATSGVVLTGGASNIKSIVPYLKKRWQVAVHLSNLNPKIDIYTKDVSDDTLKYLKQLIEDKTLHTAFGAMIYSKSEQFNLNQKSNELYHSNSGVLGWFESFNKKIDGWLESFTKKF